MRKTLWILFFFLLGLLPSQVMADTTPRQVNAKHISLPSGYHIEPVVMNLSVPTTALFDGKDLLIAESGWVDTAKPRILRIQPQGNVITEVEDGLQSPVTGLLMYQGKLYISHRGKVSILENGSLRDIVTGLPSLGDHQNDNLVVGPDGKLYMGQGTTTNSGVVGEDSYVYGWLSARPQAHDIPCKDITLTGQNFTTDNPLTSENDKAITGAYKPFGVSSKPGEVIPGNTKCSGSILRFNPDGSDLEVYAWGLRNPFGLKFDQNGQLWATFHGSDARGSRPIYNDSDYFVRVQQDAWYGWPEYVNGKPVTDPAFKDPLKPQPEFIWKDHPDVSLPFATFESHAAANGFAFSRGDTFGYAGDAFVALYGTFSVATAGTDPRIPGFKVVRVSPVTGEIADFASNTLPGPSYLNRQGGFDRPSDVLFAPDSSMYIVDWGSSTIGSQGLKYIAGTGMVWRVYTDAMQPVRSQGPIIVKAAPVPDNKQKAELRNVPELYKAMAPYLTLMVLFVLIVLGIVIFLWRRQRKASKSRKKINK